MTGEARQTVDGTPPATWFDSHCHLQDSDDVAATLQRAADRGVGYEVCIGTGAASSAEAIRIARDASTTGAKVWATVGLHPHDAVEGIADIQSLLDETLEIEIAEGVGIPPNSVVAIGECGLDYYYEHSPRDTQRDVFARQIELAHRYDLALVVHTRDAWDDTVAILQEVGVPSRTIIHCFSGGTAEARRCLDLGAYLSFSGIVTFKNANDVRDAAELCPMDRLLVETDSPYLAPVPHRGKANEPAYVTLVGATVAAIKHVPPSELAETTTDNACTVFAVHR